MTLQEWLEAYEASHRNLTNQRVHRVCVPVIAVSLLAMLAVVPWPGRGPWWHAGTVAVCLALWFYARLSRPLAVGMAIAGLIVLAILGLALCHGVPVLAIALPAFVAGWVGQFVGHRIEGTKPSFFQDLQFLLVGPLWLLADLYRWRAHGCHLGPLRGVCRKDKPRGDSR